MNDWHVGPLVTDPSTGNLLYVIRGPNMEEVALVNAVMTNGLSNALHISLVPIFKQIISAILLTDDERSIALIHHYLRNIEWIGFAVPEVDDMVLQEPNK